MVVTSSSIISLSAGRKGRQMNSSGGSSVQNRSNRVCMAAGSVASAATAMNLFGRSETLGQLVERAGLATIATIVLAIRASSDEMRSGIAGRTDDERLASAFNVTGFSGSFASAAGYGVRPTGMRPDPPRRYRGLQSAHATDQALRASDRRDDYAAPDFRMVPATGRTPFSTAWPRG